MLTLWLREYKKQKVFLVKGMIMDRHEDADEIKENEVSPNEAELVKPTGQGISDEEIERITNDVIAAIKTVYDPEIPVDIYELGLIYKIELNDDKSLTIDMTLTAPGCPVAGEMPIWVENAVVSVEGVMGAEVKMVFDPPWSADRMSEEAQVALNLW